MKLMLIGLLAVMLPGCAFLTTTASPNAGKVEVTWTDNTVRRWGEEVGEPVPIPAPWVLPVVPGYVLEKVSIRAHLFHWCLSDLAFFVRYNGRRGVLRFCQENEDGYYDVMETHFVAGDTGGLPLEIAAYDLLAGDGGWLAGLEAVASYLPAWQVRPVVDSSAITNEWEWLREMSIDAIDAKRSKWLK